MDDPISGTEPRYGASGKTAPILAVVTTAGLFGLLGLFAYREIPPGSRDLANIMLGSIATGWSAIISYYFGSSAGSDQATRALAALTTPNTEKT